MLDFYLYLLLSFELGGEKKTKGAALTFVSIKFLFIIIIVGGADGLGSEYIPVVVFYIVSYCHCHIIYKCLCNMHRYT